MTPPTLTPRQLQIIRLVVGRGLPIKSAAAELNLSTQTIDAHLKNARAALGVNRYDAPGMYRRCHELRIVDPMVSPAESMRSKMIRLASELLLAAESLPESCAARVQTMTPEQRRARDIALSAIRTKRRRAAFKANGKTTRGTLRLLRALP